MAGSHVVEVSAVHGGDGGDAKPFGNRDQRGVGATHASVAVLPDEFRHPAQIDVSEVERTETTVTLAANRVEEPSLSNRAAEAVDEVARLGQNGDRQGQRVGLFFQPAAAAFVIGVGVVGQRHDDVGIYQDHDERSAAEAVGKQLIYPLREVVAPAVEAPNELRQRLPPSLNFGGAGMRDRLDYSQRTLDLLVVHAVDK